MRREKTHEFYAKPGSTCAVVDSSWVRVEQLNGTEVVPRCKRNVSSGVSSLSRLKNIVGVVRLKEKRMRDALYRICIPSPHQPTSKAHTEKSVRLTG